MRQILVRQTRSIIKGCGVIKSSTHLIFTTLLFVSLLVLTSFQSAQARDVEINSHSINNDNFSIYLSPYGDDDNSGLSLTKPVLSLQRAQDILRNYLPQRPVDIYITAGTYYFQEVKWRYTNGHPITFKAYNETTKRPVFDGSLVSDTWFTFDGTAGKYSQLNFRHIKVQNYSVAMTFRGDRERRWRWNGGNELYSMYFYRIGGKFYSAKHSTAAVRFINSRDNRIRNSHFVDILNRADTAHLIHPVYLAHYSSNNIIENNRFVRSNGNPIAVRDSSDFNQFRMNKFISTGDTAIYQDWYCVQGQDRCTKRLMECPSVGNVMSENIVENGYKGQVRYFNLFRDNEYCGSTSNARLRTWSNIRK